MKRSPEEPAFVLHRYDWSESSLILEVFTRHFGRIALAAKGVKRPHSSLRPVLLPLQPLRLSFGGEAEVRTLKSAEWSGGQVMPSGQVLLTGYYVNELLLRLLAREDPHERLFDSYSELIRMIGRLPLVFSDLVVLRVSVADEIETLVGRHRMVVVENNFIGIAAFRTSDHAPHGGVPFVTLIPYCLDMLLPGHGANLHIQSDLTPGLRYQLGGLVGLGVGALGP